MKEQKEPKIALIPPGTATVTHVQAEANFKLLIESVKDYGIFLLDTEGYIQSWNAGAERIKGYSAEEIIGKHFSIFYTRQDLDKDHPRFELEQVILHGRYEEEGWRVRRNGTQFWANIVITALKDATGKHVGFAKVTRDLTERREAEEKLKQSEERARRMFEGVKDYAMIMLNPDGTIASWNEGARRIKGYEAHEVIGQYFSIFYLDHDIQMGKCEYELKEAAETGRFEEENWRIRKDGTRFWANVLITAIRSEKGQVLGFSKVTRDMTDRKRADDLLKMAYASLERRVEERTTALVRANEELKAAVHSRDEFLSIASHELRTPLTPLKLQIQAVIQNIRKGSLEKFSEERLGRMAATCDRSVSRLGSLIDNLLDVSRINTGRLILNCEQFDLSTMAQEIIERYRLEIAASGSELKLLDPTPVVGNFDRLRMEQVFVNFLTNALKYGSKKPIEIEVSAEDATAILIFRDQGLGIAKKDHQKIFERFERIPSPNNVGGLGLGLFISRQIVEAHQGQIAVESRLGAGSTFQIKLPLIRIPGR